MTRRSYIVPNLMTASLVKTKYVFSLFAPNNKAASLIGDFSDWKGIPMVKGDDGNFTATVEVDDGSYAYKFNIQSKSWFNEPDEWKTISDPYATNVDPETQNSILVIKDGKKVVDEYVWQSDDVPLPTNDRLVIYEMHVGDFSGGESDIFTRGKYTDVIAKLDYLAELGVNAIEMMPLKSNPGDFNWGYSPIHYFTPESSFGTTAELKELVDKCHGLGIRVIVDGVYNHASTDNALAQIDHDYWFRHEGKDPEQNWGPEFNYETLDERFGIIPALKFITDSIKYWIFEYRIDGVRFDAAKQIDNFDALRTFVASAREMSAMKPFFTVAEFIPPSPEVTEPEGPVESCWNDAFMYAVVDYLSGDPLELERLKDAIDPSRLGFVGATSVTNYLANHDQNRLFRKLGEKGILDDELYRRARLGAVILLTAVGVPMIWMGGEFGEYVPMSEQSNKINWTLLENGNNKDLLEYYRRLVRVRTSNEAFRTAAIDFFYEDPVAGVLCYKRFGDGGNCIAVVLNLSDKDISGCVIPEFPILGTCLEVTTGATIEITGAELTIDIERRSGLVFTG
ncbi:MAG: alpha-amylase family glycosyl hydrolase [Acidobacteriota bacterium]